jgi:GNAT superfamily N-acetyltransferase
MEKQVIEIHRAQEEHISGILEIWKDFVTFQIECEPDWDPGKNAKEKFEKYLKNNLTTKNVLILVAIDAGILVGFSLAVLHDRLSFFKTKKWGTISDMAVRASHQKKGAGNKMLIHTLEWFRRNNIPVVEVSVLAANHGGLDFWKKNGFSAFSQRLYRNIVLDKTKGSLISLI